MAALAESLVDEWLNRQGFFTVRGVKQGVDEIDLLGVRPTKGGQLEAWHVEVQASFRPIGYIAPLTKKEIEGAFATIKTAAKVRPREMIRSCAHTWAAKKFHAPKKEALRSSAWPGLKWRCVLVHGVVKDPFEVECIGECNVETMPLHKILANLRHRDARGIRGMAGTDLSEIIEYYNDHVANTPPHK